jgi:serine/threonine-protein kinase
MPSTRPADALDPTRLAGLKLGNYRLERLLGRGRMGVVYLATDEALLRPTAVKLLSWKASDAQGHDPLRWFLAEARLVARINHPRVVQIYGAARQDDHCYIAMEYVLGRSAEAMVAEGRLAPEVATEIVLQAAGALAAAHRSGVIHRDVKPANLLVGAGGATKLGDFGMALGSADLSAGNARVRVGTPYYTAPEIWGGAAATAASDVYSLGATYYHLLTGAPPFPGDDVATVEHGHRHLAVPDPRARVADLPASAAALVVRALAKDPRARHPSAAALAWEARRVLQDLAGTVGGAAGSAAAHAPAAGAGLPPPPPPALPTALRALGLARRPFAGPAPAGLLEAWPPLAAARAAVAARLDREGAAALALACPESGSGPGLRRRLAEALARGRSVLPLEVPAGAGEAAVLQLACRAGGVAEASSADGSLEALVEALSGEGARAGPAPLLLAGLGPRAGGADPSAAGLARLVEAARFSGAFRVVLAGPPGLAAAVGRAGAGGEAQVAEVALPAPSRADLEAWVRAGIDAALAPRAGPILLTRDAALLLALRAEGRLERAEALAENMLALAAAEGRRVLSSWHAWAAPDGARLAESGGPLPRRPEPWPSPEVADVLDACRRAAGMPPWPRHATRCP